MAEHLDLLKSFGASVVTAPSQLIAAQDTGDFAASASRPLSDTERGEILCRALSFALQASDGAIEVSFITLYAALESILTYFRRKRDYEILSDADFAQLERDLKAWLRQHPLLASEDAKRGLIYEKMRELNRFPFSHVFKEFCARHALDLTDLWPIAGRADAWPLMEIRHRFVHGDPFLNRPPEALACALRHLRWTVQRMILSALNWPIARSGVSAERLRAHAGADYTNWPAQRAKLS